MKGVGRKKSKGSISWKRLRSPMPEEGEP